MARDQSTDVALQYNINCNGTHKQTEGRSVNAALFAEELVEIYNTATPNAVAKAGKDCIDCVFVSLYNSEGLIFIPGTKT
jgi:hypothetical protein